MIARINNIYPYLLVEFLFEYSSIFCIGIYREVLDHLNTTALIQILKLSMHSWI